MDTAERIREFVAPLVTEAGAEIYDIEYAGGVLLVTLDREGGVGIDVIGKVTRGISHLLDEVDPIPGQYTLEVSSPGLERPLRRPEHYTRAIGTKVAIKTRPGIAGDRRATGTLTAVDERGFTVETGAEPPAEASRWFAFDDVERARTVFEWGPQPKPGGARAVTPSAKQKKAARS